jgi:hypothetical protein
MSEQHLDIHELGAGLEQPCSVSVPELMRGDLLINAYPGYRTQLRAIRLAPAQTFAPRQRM